MILRSADPASPESIQALRSSTSSRIEAKTSKCERFKAFSLLKSCDNGVQKVPLPLFGAQEELPEAVDPQEQPDLRLFKLLTKRLAGEADGEGLEKGHLKG